MSVRFYMLRRDIPDDCAYDVCADETAIIFDAKGLYVDVTYLYDDKLEAKYPALYPDYFEGKKCRQVAYRLGVALRNCRAKELKRFSYLTRDERAQRLNGMLQGLSRVLRICIDHPDWKLVLES